MKRMVMVAGLVAGIVWATGSGAAAETAPNQPKDKEFRIERSMPKEAIACIECHKREQPGHLCGLGPQPSRQRQHHLSRLPPGRGV